MGEQIGTHVKDNFRPTLVAILDRTQTMTIEMTMVTSSRTLHQIRCGVSFCGTALFRASCVSRGPHSEAREPMYWSSARARSFICFLI